MVYGYEDYWPPKREKVFSGGRPPSLTPAQQEQAIMLIRQGMPLQKVAELFNTSYEVIRRLAKSQEVEFRRNGKKLTVEQLEEGFGLLSADMPLREVAEQFGIIMSLFGNLHSVTGLKCGQEGRSYH
jgi:helix-turn-helix resolvase-like protein